MSDWLSTLRTALVSRQMRLNLRPLLFAKPRKLDAHGWVPMLLTKPLNLKMVN